MVRRGVERRVDTAGRVDPRAAVCAHLEGAHAGDVGLEGQALQLEQQVDVLIERLRHARRRSRLPSPARGCSPSFDRLDAPLHRADLFQIGVHGGAISRTDRASKPDAAVGGFVENASACARPPGGAGRPPVSVQPFEDRAWAALHRQGTRRRCPADRVRVPATVAVAAGFRRRLQILDAQLQRRQARALPQLPRDELIERRAGLDVRPGGQSRMRRSQKHRRRAGVVRAIAALERSQRHGVLQFRVADDRHVLAERLQRLERARELEIPSLLHRRPVVPEAAERRAAGRAVNHLDGDETHWRCGRRLSQQRVSGDHRVEEWQGKRRAQSPQDQATRHMGLRADHGGTPD